MLHCLGFDSEPGIRMQATPPQTRLLRITRRVSALADTVESLTARLDRLEV